MTTDPHADDVSRPQVTSHPSSQEPSSAPSRRTGPSSLPPYSPRSAQSRRPAESQRPAGAEDGSGDGRPRHRRGGPWSGVGHVVKEVVVVGATALFISFLIKTFVVQAFWIPSGSMEQTLVYGDRVMVSKITAGPLEIERGDIAVFRDPGGWLPPTVPTDRGPFLNVVVGAMEFVGLAPASDGDHLIKRVIGMGGDHVVCCDDEGRITVNDVPLEEDYLFPGDVPSQQPFDVVVPEDHYWMMGDHRSNSRDSRANDDGSGSQGAVPEDHMVGRALVLIWPLDRFDWFDGARDTFAPVQSGQEQR